MKTTQVLHFFTPEHFLPCLLSRVVATVLIRTAVAACQRAVPDRTAACQMELFTVSQSFEAAVSLQDLPGCLRFNDAVPYEDPGAGL